METTVIHIADMECAACAQRIGRVLRAMRGVESAAVSFLAGTASVAYDPAQVTPDDLARGVRRAGCTVSEKGTPTAPRRHRLARLSLLAAALEAWGVLRLLFGARSPWLWLLLPGGVLVGALLWQYALAQRDYRAAEPVRRLLRFQPRRAQVIRSGGQVQLWLDEVQPGDTVLVCAGERVPADGVVLTGECEADESLFSGDAALLKKQAGDALLGGTLVRSGDVRFTVTAVGESSALFRKADSMLKRAKRAS